MKSYFNLIFCLLFLTTTVNSEELAGGVSFSPESSQQDFKNLLNFAAVPFSIQSKYGTEYIYWKKSYDSKVNKIRNIVFEGKLRDKATVSEALGNLEKYRFYLSKAAEKGDFEAQGAIGGNYLVGRKPFEKDITKAKHWLELALNNKNHLVAGMLAGIYEKKNYPDKTIHDTYLKGANAGDQISMCKIAKFHDDGKYTFVRNSSLAEEWREKSRKSGINCSFFDKYEKK